MCNFLLKMLSKRYDNASLNISQETFSLTVTVSVLIENHHQTVTLTRDATGLGLLTTRLVPMSKQRPVDAAQVVCPLVPVHDK